MALNNRIYSLNPFKEPSSSRGAKSLKAKNRQRHALSDGSAAGSLLALSQPVTATNPGRPGLFQCLILVSASIFSWHHSCLCLCAHHLSLQGPQSSWVRAHPNSKMTSPQLDHTCKHLISKSGHISRFLVNAFVGDTPQASAGAM